MKFIKKITLFVICLILLFSAAYIVFAQYTDNNRIRVGAFILLGLETNFDESEKPDWFKEYVREMYASGTGLSIYDYAETNHLFVSREQLEEIKILYSDDLAIPIIYSSEQLERAFSDFEGIEYLTGLKRIGTYESTFTEDNYKYGINGYNFGEEQIQSYYKPFIINFKKINAHELWPDLDFDTLRSLGNYPYDIELREYTRLKIVDNERRVYNDIENANLAQEDKIKLNNELSLKAERRYEEINNMCAYDLSSYDFTSEFEVIVLEEFEEIRSKIALLERVDILVNKIWSDNSTDKEAIIKLLKKSDSENSSEVYMDSGMLNSGSNNILRDIGNDEDIPYGYEFVTKEEEPLSIILSSDNNYQGVFEELAKYDDTGKLIRYKVYEANIEGYNSTVIKNGDYNFTVINERVETLTNAPDDDNDENEEDNEIISNLEEEISSTTDIEAEEVNKATNTEADIIFFDNIIEGNNQVDNIYNKVGITTGKRGFKESEILNIVDKKDEKAIFESPQITSAVNNSSYINTKVPKTGYNKSIIFYIVSAMISGVICARFITGRKINI